MLRSNQPLIFLLSTFLILNGCNSFNTFERKLQFDLPKNTLPENLYKENNIKPAYLKAHMKNGDVFVLSKWRSSREEKSINGFGVLFNAARDTVKRGEFNINIDSVAIFESNKLESSGTQTAISIYTGISAAITIACLANPKACFGSCPTFYVEENNKKYLRAEGFSSSISPSLENADLDQLNIESCGEKEISIEMRNEALETHVVKYVDLIAVPKKKEKRVFADKAGKFWESSCQYVPVKANAPEGNILSLINKMDGKERSSKADSSYLGEQEIIELEFEKTQNQNCGLVLSARQALLSTYLLYQAFAYMGKEAGYWFSQIEKGTLSNRVDPIEKIIGEIKILRKNSSGVWKVVDVIDENGPLAPDIHLIHLDNFCGGEDKIRLQTTKGNWRIDYAAIAAELTPAYPIRINPDRIFKEGVLNEEARSIFSDNKKHLTTLPGDSYEIKFKIPADHESYELFLESKGYYLEWMRKEWMKEENKNYLAQMFLNPKEALKRLAPQYKQVEKQMEENFWSSRYAKP